MKAYDILTIVEFLGEDITADQAERLMDEVRAMSIADREWLIDMVPGGLFYTDLSMHNAEMGGLSRYS